MKKRAMKSIGIGVALGIFFYWQNNGLTLAEGFSYVRIQS